MDDNVKIGKKLKNLREKAGLTQTELFNKLQELLDKKEGTSYSEVKNDFDKQKISKIETGKVLISIRMAIAYAEYFNTSLDYIYLDKESYKSEYDDIKVMLGFTDNALNKLEHLNQNNKHIINVLNKMLEPNVFNTFANMLNEFSWYISEFNDPIEKMLPKDTVIDIGYRKIKLQRPSISRNNMSLFNISEISKDLAKELKKGGKNK